MKERLLRILETRGIGNDQMDINLVLTVPTMDAAKKIIQKNDEMKMKEHFFSYLKTRGIGCNQTGMCLFLTVHTFRIDATKPNIQKRVAMTTTEHFFSHLKIRGIGINQTDISLYLTVHTFRTDASKPIMQERVEMPMLLIGRRLEVFMNQMTISLVHQIWTDAAKKTLRRIGKPAAIVGVTIQLVLEPDIASTNGHIFTIEQPKGASSYRLYANKGKSLVLGDADYRMQLLIKERKNVETLRLKLNPFNLENRYNWLAMHQTEPFHETDIVITEADYFLQEEPTYFRKHWFCLRGVITDARVNNVTTSMFQVSDDNYHYQRLYEAISRHGFCLTSFDQVTYADYQLQSLKQRMENMKKKILLYDPLNQDYRFQSLIQMMEYVEKLILLLDSLDQDDCYRMRRLIGKMEHVEKQMLFLDLYHQDAYYRMLRMIKGMENVIIPKLWLTPFGQDDWVIHVAKLHPRTTVRNKDEVHKHKEKTDDDYQCLQPKEALDLQQYCEKDKMKVVDGRIASETRALWNRFLSGVQIDNKPKMKRLRTIYGKDCIKPEQLEGRQPNAMRIKRSG